jgi:hypothetical protein
MYFDHTYVNVYPRELKSLKGPERYVTEQWADNLRVTYDSRITDLREKRYGITIGKNVFDSYGRDEKKAVHEVTEKIVVDRKLCSKGWTMVSRGVTNYSGGIGWTVLCN